MTELRDRSPFTFRHIDKSRVVGKVEPVTLYQVVDAETEAVRACLIPNLHDYAAKARDRLHLLSFHWIEAPNLQDQFLRAC